MILKPDEGRAVLADVSQERGISRNLLLSEYRHAPLVDARREVARRLRVLKWSTVQIGELLRRDHSTIVCLLRPRALRAQWLEKQKVSAAQRMEAA